jgi:hypothetical protein
MPFSNYIVPSCNSLPVPSKISHAFVGERATEPNEIAPIASFDKMFL